ncbi:MAG: non-heme chloroperoxidase, partial [Mycobacterium sp.]|nr:non-heme chloroperoxidase [Mycobacterium sp.]
SDQRRHPRHEQDRRPHPDIARRRDQIAPVGNATLAAALVPDAILKIYPGAPHAMTTTHKDQVNQDLLSFITA